MQRPPVVIHVPLGAVAAIVAAVAMSAAATVGPIYELDGDRSAYRIRPVPPSFTADDDTSFVADLTKTPDRAEAAGGDPAIVFADDDRPTTTGVRGGIRIAGPGNLDPARWTIEAVVRFDPSVGDGDLDAGGWERPGACRCLLEFDRSVGARVQAIVEPGASGSDQRIRAAAAAGGNGISLRGTAGGDPVYVAFGVDLDRRLAAAIVRDLDGDLLGHHVTFAGTGRVTGAQPGSPRGEIAPRQALEPPTTLRFGGPGIVLERIRISTRFRDEILAPAIRDLPPGARTATDLAPDRAEERVATRHLGYPGRRPTLEKDVTESFVPLAPGEEIRIPLPGLAPGLYSIFPWGRIDDDGRARLPRTWRPAPMEFRVEDAAGERVESGRLLLKQGFAPRRMQGFHLHVDRHGDYTAILRLDEKSLERVEILYVDIIDRLEGLPDRAIKQSRNLDEPAATPRRLSRLTSKRQQRDDRIWAALPPMNVHLQIHPPPPAFTPPPDAPVGAWENAPWVGVPSYRRADRTFAPLDLIDTITGARLEHADVVAGEPWPGPLPDDGTGVFFAAADWPGLEHDVLTTRRAELLGARYRVFLGAIVDPHGQYHGLNLAHRYAETGDSEAGHDAALALVRFARDWPVSELSLREPRLCSHAPDYEYGVDWSHAHRRNGKHVYDGWAGSEFEELLIAYDRVFPYIDGNQVFADAAQRFLPEIHTPEDVVRFLDRRLVFAGVRDVDRGLIRGAPVREMAYRVLGDAPETIPWIDLTRTRIRLHPYEGTFEELYATALTRDGIHYIGSFLSYGADMARGLLLRADAVADARDRGAHPEMDLADVERYPKVRAAADFLVDRFCAGGYPIMVGDAGGGPHAGREGERRLRGEADASRTAVRLFGDPRHAWLLRHLHGVEDPSIAELAGECPADPLLVNRSRVLAGAGAAVVEVNGSSVDPLRKGAMVVRTGIGRGHAHDDCLDLNLFGLGLPMAVDLACRSEGHSWSRPPAAWAFLHNHALAHANLDPRGEGQQAGEPWVTTFAPPLVRARYEEPGGRVTLDRDLWLRTVGDDGAFYVFDLQRLRGGVHHTWSFHGCESDELELNTATAPPSGPAARWIDRLLEPTRGVGTAPETLVATWTMTRAGRNLEHRFGDGGTVHTVACEPTVLGPLYRADRPPARTRARLLGRAGDRVLVGAPYSEPYQYAFPFLWVQSDADGDRPTVYPALYEVYRGDAGPILRAEIIGAGPDADATPDDDARTVRVTRTDGVTDEFRADGDALSLVSRRGDRVVAAELSGPGRLEIGPWAIEPDVGLVETVIERIRYGPDRSLTTRDPLPPDPAVTAGGPGRRIYLQLHGAGVSYRFDDDLLVGHSELAGMRTDPDGRIGIETSQPVAFAGVGNRDPAAFTHTDETGAWAVRDGRVIARPAGDADGVPRFTDADGDGRVEVRTWEIGVGDPVRVRALVRVAADGDRWRIESNVPATLELDDGRIPFPPGARLCDRYGAVIED